MPTEQNQAALDDDNDEATNNDDPILHHRRHHRQQRQILYTRLIHCDDQAGSISIPTRINDDGSENDDNEQQQQTTRTGQGKQKMIRQFHHVSL